MHYDEYDKELKDAAMGEAKERIVALLEKFDFDDVTYMQKVAINIKKYKEFESFIQFVQR